MDTVEPSFVPRSSSLEAVGPLTLSDMSGVGEARRVAQRLAAAAALSEDEQGRVGIVATELATNQVRHGRGGMMTFEPLIGARQAGVRIIAIDRGPGMDIGATMRDGYSSKGTAGNGLGAIQRQSDATDFHSSAHGTTVVARIGGEDVLNAGAFSVPYPGEEVCGDAWAVSTSGGCRTVLVVDGLGHGALAAEAARVAVESFLSHAAAPVETILRVLHGALRPTRGAALAIARIDDDQRVLRYGGVGNISASIFVAQSHRSLISHNGTMGLEARKFQEFVYDWTPESILIMHSDGLSTQWKLGDTPGLAQRSPSLIASVLVREYSRGRDDATALVLKAREALQ